ncbi:unnamed protein product [Orchesella dallaii]|uniref:Uncharacterized protein n=1 Tax=Orchesella dallaii TaxID=48710 RepID=A0ABP1S6M0_9HEXA
MNNQNGSGQNSMAVVPGDNSMKGSAAPPVYLQQNSAFNVFMMGQGQASVNFGYYSPVPNAAASENAWGTTSNFQFIPPDLMFQQVRRQEQQPLIGPTATGTTVPQSGYVKNLKAMRNSSGGNATNNGGQPGNNGDSSSGSESVGRVTRSKTKMVSFSDPFVTNGNSPQSQQGGGSDGAAGGGSSTSDL